MAGHRESVKRAMQNRPAAVEVVAQDEATDADRDSNGQQPSPDERGGSEMALMTAQERDDKLMELHGMVTTLVSRDKDYHATLYGNGQPGLVSCVARIATTQKQCPARARSGRDDRMFYIAAVSVVVSVAAVALGVAGVIGG